MREHVAARSRARVGARAGRAPGRLARLREKLHLSRSRSCSCRSLPLLLLALPSSPSSFGIHERRDGTPPHVKQEEERDPRARGARGPPRPQPVHGGRPRQARAVPAPDAERRPLRAQLHDAPHLQPRQPLRRQDDPLRALGLPRRQAADVLRQQLRRQPGELHGRLHRQGRVGAEPRLQQRRRLPEVALARLRRRQGRARVQGLPARAPGADPRLVLRLRRPDRAQHRAERADPRRACAAATSAKWVQSL